MLRKGVLVVSMYSYDTLGSGLWLGLDAHCSWSSSGWCMLMLLDSSWGHHVGLQLRREEHPIHVSGNTMWDTDDTLMTLGQLQLYKTTKTDTTKQQYKPSSTS